MGQLSPCATTNEPTFWSLQATTIEAQVPRGCDLQQETPLQWKALAPQIESNLHSQQLDRESWLTATKTQYCQNK